MLATHERRAALTASLSTRNICYSFHLGLKSSMEDIEGLAFNIFLTHIDSTFQIKRAAAVAVATPCRLAPFEDNFLFAHAFSEKNLSWALLILWAPVWLRSSRWGKSLAPPLCWVKFCVVKQVSHVLHTGAKVGLTSWNLDDNTISFFQLQYCCHHVSDKRPPNFP